jgi:flagellar hook assembly protein FlgD
MTAWWAHWLVDPGYIGSGPLLWVLVGVTLAIYNVLGQEVRRLVDAHHEIGTHTVMWDTKDCHGHYLKSGVYFYTLEAEDFTQTRKMVLLR